MDNLKITESELADYVYKPPTVLEFLEDALYLENIIYNGEQAEGIQKRIDIELDKK